MSKGKKGAAEEVPAIPAFDAANIVGLVANDGHTFYADRNAVRISKLCKECLAGAVPADMENLGVSVDASECGVPLVSLPFLKAAQVEAALRFMHYKCRYDAEPPEARPAFQSPLPQTEALAVATLLRC